jgi:serine/threonine protein kinase
MSYRAPEVSLGKYSVYSDVWGLGCILWKLLSKVDCFPDDQSLIQYYQGYQHHMNQRVPHTFPVGRQWVPASFQLPENLIQRQISPIAPENVFQWQRNLDATLAVNPNLRPSAATLRHVFEAILTALSGFHHRQVT